MYETKDIDFYNGKIKLSGKFYINNDEGDKKSIVILSHGLGGKKEWFEKKAIDICESGNHVFTYDFRGHGGSEGIADYDTISDIFVAIDYASKYISQDLPIILGGQCMGGLFAFYAAAKCKNVIGVIGMSITPECIVTPELWKLTVDNMNAHKGGHYVVLDNDGLYKFYQGNDVREVIKKLNSMPILLVHFENDEISPVESLISIFLHTRCEKNLVILDKGQHTSPYLYNNFNNILVWWINQKKERWFML